MTFRRMQLIKLCSMVLIVLLVSNGCVKVPAKRPFPSLLNRTDKANINTASVSRDIRFPESMIVLASYEGASTKHGALGVPISMYIKRKFEDHWSSDFDRLIKEKIDIEKYFSQSLYDKFVAGLKSQKFLEYVPSENKAQIDSEFILKVEEYGLDPLRKTPGRGPYIQISAMLIGNPPYVLIPSQKPLVSLEPDNPDRNPVLWYHRIRVWNPKKPIFPMYKMEEYYQNPELLKQNFDRAIQMAVDYLIKKLGISK